MANRRSKNRRSQRYSTYSNGSRVLDPNTLIADDERLERTLWWEDLENGATLLRPSVGSNYSTSVLDPNSNLDQSKIQSEWWNELQTDEDSPIPARIPTRRSDTKHTLRIETSSESEKETGIRKKKVPLRVTRRSLGENVFAQALNDSNSSGTAREKVRVSAERTDILRKHLQDDSSDDSDFSNVLKSKPSILSKRYKTNENKVQSKSHTNIFHEALQDQSSSYNSIQEHISKARLKINPMQSIRKESLRKKDEEDISDIIDVLEPGDVLHSTAIGHTSKAFNDNSLEANLQEKRTSKDKSRSNNNAELVSEEETSTNFIKPPKSASKFRNILKRRKSIKSRNSSNPFLEALKENSSVHEDSLKNLSTNKSVVDKNIIQSDGVSNIKTISVNPKNNNIDAVHEDNVALETSFEKIQMDTNESNDTPVLRLSSHTLESSKSEEYKNKSKNIPSLLNDLDSSEENIVPVAKPKSVFLKKSKVITKSQNESKLKHNLSKHSSPERNVEHSKEETSNQSAANTGLHSVITKDAMVLVKKFNLIDNDVILETDIERNKVLNKSEHTLDKSKTISKNKSIMHNARSMEYVEPETAETKRKTRSVTRLSTQIHSSDEEKGETNVQHLNTTLKSKTNTNTSISKRILRSSIPAEHVIDNKKSDVPNGNIKEHSKKRTLTNTSIKPKRVLRSSTPAENPLNTSNKLNDTNKNETNFAQTLIHDNTSIEHTKAKISEIRKYRSSKRRSMQMHSSDEEEDNPVPLTTHSLRRSKTPSITQSTAGKICQLPTPEEHTSIHEKSKSDSTTKNITNQKIKELSIASNTTKRTESLTPSRKLTESKRSKSLRKTTSKSHIDLSTSQQNIYRKDSSISDQIKQNTNFDEKTSLFNTTEKSTTTSIVIGTKPNIPNTKRDLPTRDSSGHFSDKEEGENNLNTKQVTIESRVSQYITSSPSKYISELSQQQYGNIITPQESQDVSTSNMSLRNKIISNILNKPTTTTVQRTIDTFLKPITNMPGMSQSQGSNPIREKLNDPEIQAKIQKLKERARAEMKLNTKVTKSEVRTPFKTGKVTKDMKSVKSVKEVDKAYIVNGQVYKRPRLPRPKPWATDRLYRHLWKMMEPKYKSMTRVRSEKFVSQLAEYVTIIRKRKTYESYKNEMTALMKEMARLGIIRTRNDFYDFCYEFLPYEFRVKVTPISMPGNKRTIPYNPETLHTPILQDSE